MKSLNKTMFKYLALAMLLFILEPSAYAAVPVNGYGLPF